MQKTAKKPTAKKTAVKKPSATKKTKRRFKSKKGGFSSQTGTMSGRLAKATKRLNILIDKYVASGMTKAKAKQRATKEMRDNTRGDWRAG